MMGPSAKRSTVDATVQEDVWIPSACGMCYSNCGIKVHRVNGVIVKIEGDPDYPHNWGRLCAKGNASIMTLYDPHRVKMPLKRTNPEKGIGVDPGWVEIGWEEALDLVAERLKKVRQDNPKKLGITTWDTSAQPLAIMPWGAGFGTPNYWFMASAIFCGAGLHMATYLTNATFHTQVDLERCNYAILFGSQLGFGIGHCPNLSTQEMSDARVRGMKLIVVDPVCTTAASKADEWVPIKPGTDGALALGMLNVILNELGTYDAEFIEKKTNGPYLVASDGYYFREEASQKPLVWDMDSEKAVPFDSPGVSRMAIEGAYKLGDKTCHPSFQLLKAHVKSYTPEKVSGITTVPADTIRRLSEEYVKAACIGSTVTIEGKQLPYRPATVHMYRGAYSHAHAAHHALAIQLLNIVVGNFYVPGGHYGPNPVGPWWEPKEGVDGLLVAHEEIQRGIPPYSFLSIKPERPKAACLETLFPIAFARASAELMGYQEPEKFGVPPLEVLIHCRSNVMMSTVAPADVEAALKKIPFQVSFVNLLDETAEFADIVFPDAHFLERMDPNPIQPYMQNPTSEYWYWGFRQPAVKPPFKAPHWLDLLVELADRAGFLEDVNRILTTTLKKGETIKLEPKRKYTHTELSDIWLKANAGDGTKGVAWFGEHGHNKYKKKIGELFPSLTIKQRIPLYYEHFLRAKSFVDEVAEKMNIPWDTEDYAPLMDWKACPAYEPQGDYDLFVVNYTLPFHNYTITPENPWLAEISERHPYAHKVMINTETARKQGIQDGTMIWVETPAGRKVKGQAKVTECIHPEVIAIAGVFGAWSKHKPIALGKGVHFNSLLSFDMKHLDAISCSADACARVRVRPV